MAGNLCGNPDCADLPDEDGPCNKYIPCECGWPPSWGAEHCRSCVHGIVCHRKGVPMFKRWFLAARDMAAALYFFAFPPKPPGPSAS